MNGEILLSKWWQTESCRQAFARVETQRRERIERVRQDFAERKAKLQQDVDQWSAQQERELL